MNTPDFPSRCTHLAQSQTIGPLSAGCEECLKRGDAWVHLRVCMVCGHVGCCDDSTNRHAYQHYLETGHPIIRSMEPGEDWMWCYEDRVVMV
ncbi:MAG: UBP-type zinc finger domain-containing protein [Chloroflexi bacterium]|nr:UBP-type zinc finger domain-containing protein [Anaerolineaceae bacterium]NMB88579.1 UBP-type zinc finger domain-containing protein [Chloroflexota bacterium]